MKPIIPSINYHITKACNMKCKFCFATFKASSDLSIPTPIASLYSSSKLNIIHPEPVPKSKILQNFPCDNVCSINVSVSGRGSKTLGEIINLFFQKYLSPIICEIGWNSKRL